MPGWVRALPGRGVRRARAVRIVVVGPFRLGPLLRFTVPERGELSHYTIHVLQVTGADYGLRDAGEYGAVIAK